MAVLTNFGIPSPDASGNNILMPKLKYRFRVTFIGLGNEKSGSNLVTQNVMTVTRPQLTQEPVVIDVYNSKIHVAGKHTWGDISLTIRDDISSVVSRAIGSQMSTQVNQLAQSSAKVGSDYKFAMKIETLDGSSDDNTVPLDSWEVVGCWITDINYGDMDYSASDVVQIQATIKFDNAEHTIAGSKVLQTPHDKSGSNATSSI